MEILLWLALAALLYTYVGYPLLLWLVVRVRGERLIRRHPIRPRVSLVVSAYNEVAVIRAKLENALRLEYPKDCLEIIVISDASTDGTDDVVREYAGRKVRLVRQTVRLGKTAGLNAVVPSLAGEIVVFSDANAMYAPDALQKLVRNFADPQVGCVTGEARYLVNGPGAADVGERAYWNYEIQIKRLETAVGSMVGGDGAIYAIRKELWRTLPDNAINDFLNPLQIVASGWRAIYEPAAVCFEETAGGFSTEYRRRVRIVSRSWRAVFQASDVLNPFKVGFFSVSVISHKVLRWFSGAFIAAGAIASLALVIRAASLPRGVMLITGAVAMMLCLLVPAVRRGAEVGLYFMAITAASLAGLMKGTTGHVQGTWSTARSARVLSGGASPPMALFAPGVAILLLGVAMVVVILALVVARDVTAGLMSVFWMSIVMLLYVYVLYPLGLGVFRRSIRRMVVRAPSDQAVCLFITAHNEAPVIGAKLRNSLALDYPKDQLTILVASDGSVDGTNDIVRSFAAAGVRLLAFPDRRGKIAAINEAMTSVTAHFVVFSDANTLLEPDAVRALVRNFADPTVGAVSGDVILEGERAALGSSEDLYYRYERWLQACESEIGTMVGVDGALYAMRRELFVPPPADTILDDMAIPMAVVRADRRVVFEPAARAHERGCETATEEFVRKTRVVAGAVQFLRRPDSAVPRHNRQLIVAMVSHKAFRWLSPVFAFMAFASSLALSAHSRWFLIAVAVQAAFLLTGLAGCSPALRRVTVIGIAHYFWLIQAAAAVGVVRGLFGQQPVTWRRFERPSVEAA